MFSIFLGSAAAVLLLASIVYLQLQKDKKEQKEEMLEEELQYELEESVNSQEHECCGGRCGDGCNCEKILEEEPIMPIMIEEEEEIVYINEGASSSKKYHNRPDAHHMDGAVAIPRKRAEEEGFVPCGKCFKK